MSTVHRFCCLSECTKDADVEIISNTGHPEDYTDSCLEHIGEMLGSSMTDQEWDTFSYSLVPIALQR